MSAKPEAAILKRKNVVLDQIKIDHMKHIFANDTEQKLRLASSRRWLSNSGAIWIAALATHRQRRFQRPFWRAEKLALTDVPSRFQCLYSRVQQCQLRR
jgi:hypothetical protein